MTKLLPILFESNLSPEAELYYDLKQYVEDNLLPMALQSGFRFPTPEEVKKKKLDTPYYTERPENKKIWFLFHDTEPDVKLDLQITRENVYPSQKQTFLLYSYLTGMQGRENMLDNHFSVNDSVYEKAEQEGIVQQFAKMLRDVPVAAENIRKFKEDNPELYQDDDEIGQQREEGYFDY